MKKSYGLIVKTDWRFGVSGVQAIAINPVMEYEKKQGRYPRDFHNTKNLGYDIESNGRLIEVKGRSVGGKVVWLTQNEYNFLRKTITHIYMLY